MVIAETTRRLLGNLFELKDLGARDLKGVAEPLRAWVALPASTVESVRNTIAAVRSAGETSGDSFASGGCSRFAIASLRAATMDRATWPEQVRP